MSEYVKIRLYINTGFVGAKYEDYQEVERNYWEALTPQQQENFMNEMALEFMHNLIECGAYVVEDE